MVARGELPPDFTARRTAARRTASPRAASTFSPVRPQVVWAGALSSCPRRPASTADPALRGLVGEVGGEDHRQAEVPAGKGERQVPGEIAGVHDDQDRVRSGLEEVGPERVVAGRLVVQRTSPGQVHQPCLAPAGRDEAPLEGDRRARSIRGLDEAVAGAREERGLADVGPADHGHHRPPVGRVVEIGGGGCRLTGRCGHRSGSSAVANGRVSTCAATLEEIASRARPTSTTSGPPSGVRAATTTRLPGRMPSRSSSARSGPSMPVITLSSADGGLREGQDRLRSRTSWGRARTRAEGGTPWTTVRQIKAP